jgi:hypothetical protein
MESALSSREVLKSSKLDGVNYTLWSFKIRTVVRGERVLQVVDPDIVPQMPRSSTVPLRAAPADSGESNAANTTTAATTEDSTRLTTTLPPVQDEETLMYRALRIIIPTVKDSIMSHIMNLDDPRQVWIKLCSLYQKCSMNRRLSLKSQLYSLKMIEKMSIEEHLHNVSSLTRQLANIGITISDEEIVDRVLTSLPSSWETFR